MVVTRMTAVLLFAWPSCLNYLGYIEGFHSENAINKWSKIETRGCHVISNGFELLVRSYKRPYVSRCPQPRFWYLDWTRLLPLVPQPFSFSIPSQITLSSLEEELNLPIFCVTDLKLEFPPCDGNYLEGNLQGRNRWTSSCYLSSCHQEGRVTSKRRQEDLTFSPVFF